MKKQNKQNKLTDQQVRDIMIALLKGETQKSIAARYNVCQATITFIKYGRTYQHITNS